MTARHQVLNFCYIGKQNPRGVGSVVVGPRGGSINYGYINKTNIIKHLLTTELIMSILVLIVSVIYRFRIDLIIFFYCRRDEASITLLRRFFLKGG